MFDFCSVCSPPDLMVAHHSQSESPSQLFVVLVRLCKLELVARAYVATKRIRKGCEIAVVQFFSWRRLASV